MSGPWDEHPGADPGTDTGAGAPGGQAPGSLTEEALRLLGALQEWARRSFPEPVEGHTDCQWCPLCQFAAVLRGDRPDVTERVAEAGTAIAGAVRAVLDAAATTPPRAGQHRHPDAPEGPRVQHIDLGSDD